MAQLHQNLRTRTSGICVIIPETCLENHVWKSNCSLSGHSQAQQHRVQGCTCKGHPWSPRHPPKEPTFRPCSQLCLQLVLLSRPFVQLSTRMSMLPQRSSRVLANWSVMPYTRLTAQPCSLFSAQLNGKPSACIVCRSSLILPWNFWPCFLSQCTASMPAAFARSARRFPTTLDACSAVQYNVDQSPAPLCLMFGLNINLGGACSRACMLSCCTYTWKAGHHCLM